MAKGVSIKFRSYKETIPKLLSLIKIDRELKKHSKIVLKPSLRNEKSRNTDVSFVESVLQYCLEHKNPGTQVFIAEGSDGANTLELFDKRGYRELSEKYSIGLIDLNTAEVEQIQDGEFLKFEKIMYPKILLDSFVISLPVLSEDPETEISASLSNMLGAYPADYYQGIFSKTKNKIRKWPTKYAIHDLLKCKMPEFTVIDASEQGIILAGIPLNMDKQAAKLLGKEWKTISHLRLVSESFIEKSQPKVEVAK
jgi:uncharacterized protein (DUF362 family)